MLVLTDADIVSVLRAERSSNVAKVKKTRILLVDDHPIVRQALGQLLSSESDLVVCAEAEDAQGAMRAFSQKKPNFVIVDLSLASGSGLDLIKQIRSQDKKVPILVLTMHTDASYAARSLKAGAQGYLSKQEASENVVDAVRSLMKGESFIGQTVAPELFRKLAPGGPPSEIAGVELLSDREIQVLELIGNGRTTQSVADELNLSMKTIEAYRAGIRTKLELADAQALLQFAIRWVLSH